jgi:hypothetical protein
MVSASYGLCHLYNRDTPFCWSAFALKENTLIIIIWKTLENRDFIQLIQMVICRVNVN